MVEDIAASMQQEGGQDMAAADGRMLTALTWVSRGYAKPVLQVADPEQDARNIIEHSRLQKKLAG